MNSRYEFTGNSVASLITCPLFVWGMPTSGSAFTYLVTAVATGTHARLLSTFFFTFPSRYRNSDQNYMHFYLEHCDLGMT